MRKFPEIKAVNQIIFGEDLFFDAWLYNMMTDNNIEYHMNPSLIATAEQMRFMIHLKSRNVYIPCSDATFKMLLSSTPGKLLQRQYNRAWRIVVRLIREIEPKKSARIRVLEFCRYRFMQYIRQHTVIPSRVVKRLTNIAFAVCEIEDPWIGKRREANKRANEILTSPAMQRALKKPPDHCLQADIPAMRWELDFIEIARHMYLSMMSRKWLSNEPSMLALDEAFKQCINFSAPLHNIFGPDDAPKTILFLPDADGGAIFDLALLSHLMRIGHRVIFAIKDGFYFYSPNKHDLMADEVLKEKMEKGVIVNNPAVSKNDLLRLLREHRLVIINDGTRERLNVYRTSITFARAWKEADLIMAKGWRNADTLLGTSHEFTRDILCYYLDRDGNYRIETKAQAKGAYRFSEGQLNAKADAIIDDMRKARGAGRSVMFYSCIVGSIPGQTGTAVQVVNAFINDLRAKSPSLHIVNPTEHFAEGMDGDDLMFMWERVQRSGLIDIWRFQTIEDIEAGFALLGRGVPPIWSGKDATYSTGCTKEMRIALDMQARNREMQITGPSSDKFFRRNEYGVGKYFDSTIN